ncbi:CoA ester lyase [Pseudoclavibacter sp. CFCC 13796]|nr:CoA ester lyase [Pseudoclavibacter sp. CFCC 14310]KAB1659256.1 CoA ester lyase [Pseudoclavibacter sp. CFCC 11306]KAB1662147.1 CoA ester lyase [Pseudoclavibacter sp. CFCC 13796]
MAGMGIRNERAANLPAKLSRSWLLAPPHDEQSLLDALASEADSVVFDIEDGIPDEGKDAARALAADALNNGMSAWVRINPAGSELWHRDLDALRGAEGLRGVMLAKTETAEQVALTGQGLNPGTPVVALLESGLGVENAPFIAKAPGTFRLAFGVGDFRRDTGAGNTALALAYARSRLVVASRVGELPGPIDGPVLSDDPAVITAACQVTAEMGMTGKLVLKPQQTAQINDHLAPTQSEIAWARDLLDKDAQGDGGADGSYLPRLSRAKKISRLAASFGLWNS